MLCGPHPRPVSRQDDEEEEAGTRRPWPVLFRGPFEAVLRNVDVICERAGIRLEPMQVDFIHKFAASIAPVKIKCLDKLSPVNYRRMWRMGAGLSLISKETESLHADYYRRIVSAYPDRRMFSIARIFPHERNRCEVVPAADDAPPVPLVLNEEEFVSPAFLAKSAALYFPADKREGVHKMLLNVANNEQARIFPMLPAPRPLPVPDQAPPTRKHCSVHSCLTLAFLVCLFVGSTLLLLGCVIALIQLQ